MRDIEFRAWNDAEKRMYTKVLIGNTANPDSFDYTAHCIYQNGTWVNTDEHDKNITFEQYTGLKDKNGVKVFEGDIVEVYRDNPVWENPIVDNEVVEYVGATFKMGQQLTLSNDYAMISIMVIGNIHEHKHLLE